MKKNNLICITGIFLLLLTVASCKKNTAETSTPQYDRGPFLANIGNNIIVPRYLDLKTKMATFSTSATTFTTTPTVPALVSLRSDFFAAYTSFQKISQFSFGPAYAQNLTTENSNVFPTDTVKIEQYITAGEGYDFTVSPNYSGFPAIEYLLFSRKYSDQEIVDLYKTSVSAANRQQYLKDVITFQKTKIDNTYALWVSGIKNIDIFTSNTGTDASSSLSALLNQMTVDLDNFKNYKLGLPLGAIRSIGSAPTYGASNPKQAEAYYSDSSIALMKASIIGLRDVYIGKTVSGKDSIGFDDYLIAINNSQLNTAILNQFNTVIIKLNAVPETYSQSLSDPSKKLLIEDVFVESTRLLAKLKVDLSSAINVQITPGDVDGD